MIVPLAHVGGIPVEELIPAAAGAGGVLCVARVWVWAHVRRARRQVAHR